MMKNYLKLLLRSFALIFSACEKDPIVEDIEKELEENSVDNDKDDKDNVDDNDDDSNKDQDNNVELSIFKKWKLISATANSVSIDEFTSGNFPEAKCGDIQTLEMFENNKIIYRSFADGLSFSCVEDSVEELLFKIENNKFFILDKNSKEILNEFEYVLEKDKLVFTSEISLFSEKSGKEENVKYVEVYEPTKKDFTDNDISEIMGEWKLTGIEVNESMITLDKCIEKITLTFKEDRTAIQTDIFLVDGKCKSANPEVTNYEISISKKKIKQITKGTNGAKDKIELFDYEIIDDQLIMRGTEGVKPSQKKVANFFIRTK